MLCPNPKGSQQVVGSAGYYVRPVSLETLLSARMMVSSEVYGAHSKMWTHMDQKRRDLHDQFATAGEKACGLRAKFINVCKETMKDKQCEQLRSTVCF